MSISDDRPLRVWLPAIRAGSGSDVFTERLAAALKRAGHDPILQWFRHSTEFFPDIVRRVPTPAGVDIIHTGSTLGHALAGRDAPLVVTEHQYIRHPAFLPQRSLQKVLYHNVVLYRSMRASLKRADAVVAVSEHTADAMEADIGTRPRVIHNWVDHEQFYPRASYLRGGGGPLRLLFVGNPSRWKGADVLPELASRVVQFAEIDCLGGLRREFPSTMAVGNIRQLARLPPSGMRAAYAGADVVVVPTRYEAFGYVALEAMACGLPVIGFDSTGTAEVCVDGVTALLAPVNDVERLAAHARALLDPALRRRLGEAGRIRAIEYFSEARAVQAYISVYRELLRAT
ncbi:glycosyltransferase family 4 protein [Luteibacter sp. 3190]|uniref:glycosyltransferase family 4 protein n=1 Tax=Luteibacter sp. 3190 TaxID=2817736 RepID=UPI0028576AC5|nr:glycosyltransferase family 4 protein [Luteibacter sp. 3190]MDR6934881.1 glycosyltransferase involved in cell wall biosynthesis [Luteibacter sp. 3190]